MTELPLGVCPYLCKSVEILVTPGILKSTIMLEKLVRKAPIHASTCTPIFKGWHISDISKMGSIKPKL